MFSSKCVWMISVTLTLGWMLGAANGLGKDYLLTIGGGYEPEGNQASLEANVLFYQEVLRERHASPLEQRVYFADGSDEQDDLQVLVSKSVPPSPAIEALQSIFTFDRPQVTYRNHQVPNVRGPISPSSIREGLDDFFGRLTTGDRLIVYVTAHGSAGEADNPMDTSITCWKRRPLSMQTFAKWLDRCPDDVPVVLVMAQCYCGGFADSIFTNGDPTQELSRGTRIGFFAQRHDLPAAGCRPDIENDEEYSSYFWGAFLGHSRTGKKINDVDLNHDGHISFAEAHAYAVRASATIDIPLTASDSFLRHFSRIPEYEELAAPSHAGTAPTSDGLELTHLPSDLPSLLAMASPCQRSTIESLVQQLGFAPDATIADIYRERNSENRLFEQTRFAPGRRGPGRRGPRGGARRELQREILDRWPEVEQQERWESLELLQGERGMSFFEELKKLPKYETFTQTLRERQKSREDAANEELKNVQFRRLIHTIESVVLAENLPRIAAPATLARYRAMVALENSFFE